MVPSLALDHVDIGENRELTGAENWKGMLGFNWVLTPPLSGQEIFCFSRHFIT